MIMKFCSIKYSIRWEELNNCDNKNDFKVPVHKMNVNAYMTPPPEIFFVFELKKTTIFSHGVLHNLEVAVVLPKKIENQKT